MIRTLALALIAALALPAIAEAQPKPGVGLPPMPGAKIVYAFNGDGACPAAGLVTSSDPWALIGDPHALTPAAGVSAATHGPLAVVFRDAWCRRYGGKGAAPCVCPLRGVGGDPHGVTCRGRLEAAFARGLLGDAAAWTGTPNERERDDCIHAEGVWAWLGAQLGVTAPGGGACPAGWRCTPLVELPASERPGAIANGKAVTVTAASGSGCSFFDVTRARLYVPNRRECFAGLDASCQTTASLRPECWSPPLPPEPEPPAGPALAVLDCDATGWRMRTAAGEARVALGAVVTVEGVAVSLPAACAGECPAAEVLGRVCSAVAEACP